MPVYQYQCDSCGNFDQIKKMAKARDPVNCPSCLRLARKNIVAPYLASSARNRIKVAGRNELAQNEPRHSSGHHHKHAGAHCCGSESSRISSKTRSNGAGDKMFPSMRPWMISH